MASFLTSLQESNSAVVFICTVAISFVGFYWLFGRTFKPRMPPKKDMDPPRNWTLAQIKEYTGDDGKPIYIAIDGEVYDVSEGSTFYGPGGVYHMFAGHDATRAFAKNSLDEADLDVSDLSGLTYSEQESLQGWIQKYKYFKAYPVVGQLVRPPTDLSLTVEELKEYNGKQPVPEGYVDAPIYIAVKGKVFDMSFGGKGFYGEGGPYNFLAGKDASRALAKMSFDPTDADSRNLSDLDEKQLKTLEEWETKFEGGRKYPIVGRLMG